MLRNQRRRALQRGASIVQWRKIASIVLKRVGREPTCINRTMLTTFEKVYLDPVSHGNAGWPVETIVDGIPDIENVTAALRNGPYGKCVYESTNDVCDHQVVNLEFSNGSTASFTMVAFTSTICERQTRMHFAHGEIVGDMIKFTVSDFRKKTNKVYHPRNDGSGHGGGDLGLMRSFVEAVSAGKQELLGTSVEEVLKSHLTVFAAEASRKEGRVVDCEAFEREARKAFKSLEMPKDVFDESITKDTK